MASAERGVAFLDAEREARMRTRLDDAPLMGSGPVTAEPSNAWPLGLDLEALAEREPEKPRFIMPDWLPVGYAPTRSLGPVAMRKDRPRGEDPAPMRLSSSPDVSTM